jgi:alpha-amylase
MQEWALPPAMQARYHDAAAVLGERFGSESADLLRGGHWRNFQARYPESNRLHKRMLRASSRLAERRPGDPAWESARTHLWRSQCNCPYWHGVFGGLYLPHLRSAVYRELIAAESWGVPGPRVEAGDLDFDGSPDGLLENAEWAAWVSARGARLWAFDDRRTPWNWGDTVAQRREHYHERLAQAAVGGGAGQTIHSALRLKEPGLAELVAAYDGRGREMFRDRWEEGGTRADLAERDFRLALEEGALVARRSEDDAPAIEKHYRRAGGGALEVGYLLSSRRSRRGVLSVELNVALHVREADDRWIEVDGTRADPPAPGARAAHEGVTRAAFVDQWAGRRLDVSTDRPGRLSRAPIDTVSLSEAGAEKVFQGVEARWSFPVAIEPGRDWSLTFTLAPGSA